MSPIYERLLVKSISLSILIDRVKSRRLSCNNDVNDPSDNIERRLQLLTD